MKKHFLVIAAEQHKRLRIMAANRDCTMNYLAAELIDLEWSKDIQKRANEVFSKGEKINGNKDKKVQAHG